MGLVLFHVIFLKPNFLCDAGMQLTWSCAQMKHIIFKTGLIFPNSRFKTRDIGLHRQKRVFFGTRCICSFKKQRTKKMTSFEAVLLILLAIVIMIFQNIFFGNFVIYVIKEHETTLQRLLNILYFLHALFVQVSSWWICWAQGTYGLS